MADILSASTIMLGLALFFAVILAFAYRFLKVEEDPRLAEVEEMLPGTNCGACGTPGCHAFAETLIAGGNQPSGCSVASPEGVDEIAEFLGVDAGAADKLVARLHCAGGHAQARQIADYEGFDTCRGAALVGGGGKGCAWGCLGLADCEVACGFDAIHMSVNGLPVVDIDKCTACNDCVEVCPKDLFQLQPIRSPLLVQCNVPLAGEETVQECQVACTACGVCAKDAPDEIIHMAGNLPIIDPARNSDAGPESTFRCPTGAIVWVTAGQFTQESIQPSKTQHA